MKKKSLITIAVCVVAVAAVIVCGILFSDKDAETPNGKFVGTWVALDTGLRGPDIVNYSFDVAGLVSATKGDVYDDDTVSLDGTYSLDTEKTLITIVYEKEGIKKTEQYYYSFSPDKSILTLTDAKHTNFSYKYSRGIDSTSSAS